MDRWAWAPHWAHSHLLPHLLEVIEQLQGRAEAFSDEAAALATPTHEPAGGTWSAPAVPRAATSQPPATREGPALGPTLSTVCAPQDGDTRSVPPYPQCWHKDRGRSSLPVRGSLWQEALSEDRTE